MNGNAPPLDLEAALEAGLAVQQAGDLDGAARLYSTVLRSVPTHGRALHLLGTLMRQAGRLDEAEQLGVAAVRSDPSIAEWYVGLGDTLLAKGETTEAISRYQIATHRDPASPESRTRLGLALLAAGAVPDAVESFQSALALQGEYVEAHEGLAKALFEQGKLSDALESYQTLNRLRPGHAAILRRIAFLLAEAARFQEAVATYRELVSVEAANPDNHTFLGRALLEVGQPNAALKCFLDALELNPAHPARLELEGTLRRLGRFEEADAVHQAILANAPETVDSSAGGMAVLAKRTDTLFAAATRHPASRRAWKTTESVRFFPLRIDQGLPFDRVIEEAVLKDLPSMAPPFDEHSTLVTLGSCFASHLRAHLACQGKSAEVLGVPEELNNSFALRGFLEWCLTGNRADDGYWYDRDSERGAVLWEPPQEQQTYLRTLRAADGFVITIGLAEVWRDRQTGGVFWRGVPEDIFQADRHELVLSTAEENAENIERIYSLIQEQCGPKPVVITLSPVPLNATFRGTSCVVADCASKSILRTAIEYVVMRRHPNLYYWPSFEIVRWLGPHLERAVFGGIQSFSPNRDDSRHVPQWVVEAIVNAFIKRYFAPAGGSRPTQDRGEVASPGAPTGRPKRQLSRPVQHGDLVARRKPQ